MNQVNFEFTITMLCYSVSSKNTLKPVVYAIIVIVVIGVITFAVVVALMIRRRKNNALQGMFKARLVNQILHCLFFY